MGSHARCADSEIESSNILQLFNNHSIKTMLCKLISTLTSHIVFGAFAATPVTTTTEAANMDDAAAVVTAAASAFVLTTCNQSTTAVMTTMAAATTTHAYTEHILKQGPRNIR